MKRICLALLLSGLLVVTPVLCGCGGQGAADSGQAAQTEEEPQPPVLDGLWGQRDREYGDEGMRGAIDGDTICLWFHTEEMDAIYWVGSFEAPVSEDDYTWTSTPNREMMTSAFSSQEDTKDFEYKDGQIGFDVTLQGDTTHVVLKQHSEETGVLEDGMPPTNE